MKRQTSFAGALPSSSKTFACAAFFLALTAGPAGAVKTDAYLTDTYGNVVTSSTTSSCWRTNEWRPNLGIPPCDKVAAPKVAAPAVAPRPAPKPVVAPPPAPKPAPQKFSFSADVLFDFDKAALKPAATKPLDDLVHTLKGASFESISVVGHTDRLGSAKYNMQLSQRRAKAVQDYLVVHGISAAKVRAVGRGETEPKTRPGDCKNLPRSKLIACLQPDRRVDVEVSGSKTKD